MHYLVDIMLLVSFIVLAAGASHFRLRKQASYFCAILGAAVIFRLAVSFSRERDLLGLVIDLLSLGVIFFLVDLFMEQRQKKSSKRQ